MKLKKKNSEFGRTIYQRIISRKGFRCAYCGRKKKGAYRIVDGQRSCEVCNRSYDYKEPKLAVKCPVCKGHGYFKEVMRVEP